MIAVELVPRSYLCQDRSLWKEVELMLFHLRIYFLMFRSYLCARVTTLLLLTAMTTTLMQVTIADK